MLARLAHDISHVLVQHSERGKFGGRWSWQLLRVHVDRRFRVREHDLSVFVVSALEE